MLDSLIQLNVVLRHHRDSFSTASSTSCSTHSMDVVLAVRWNVVVEDNVDMWNIQTSANRNRELVAELDKSLQARNVQNVISGSDETFENSTFLIRFFESSVSTRF